MEKGSREIKMRKAKNIIFAFLLGIVICLSACQPQMVESTQHATDKVFTNKYMKSLNGITSTDYEGYWMSEKILMFEMSEKDQGYRGVIYIDEAEAERLTNNYDWSLETADLPSMKDVSLAPVQGDTWYYSYNFGLEFSTMLQIKDLRFNKKNAVVFDVHTF